MRNFSRRIFIILNCIVILLFLLACMNAFLHPDRWWIISLLGLSFPILLLTLTGFFLLALFFRSIRIWALVSLIVLGLGWQNIHAFFAFHPGGTFKQTKEPGSIRILTWNVRSWDEFIPKVNGEAGHRIRMLEFIGQQQADVLCFQEFFESHDPATYASNIQYLQKRLHYPYYYFSRDYSRYGIYEAGVIIFSRFPIKDSLIHRYTHPDGIRTTESLIGADLDVNGIPIRIYSTHLQSVLFRSKDFHDLKVIRNVDDSILQASRSIIRKLKIAYMRRGDQAGEVRALLDECPSPAVICGDFNDVPNSYSYFTIRGGWKDAFIEKGFGIGRTYVNVSPTLRIDYILTDPRLRVLQCRKFSLPWSDHNPVIADIAIRPEEAVGTKTP